MEKHADLLLERAGAFIYRLNAQGTNDFEARVYSRNDLDKEKEVAAFIVKACNNHYQLVENLQMIERFLTHIDPVHWPSRSEARQAISNIRESIKQAESDND